MANPKSLIDSMRFHFDRSNKDKADIPEASTSSKNMFKRNSSTNSDVIFFKKPRESKSNSDDEIPATQSPPKALITNKSLQRVREQEKRMPMFSSPSILNSKPKQSSSKPTTSKTPKAFDQKTLDSTINDIFDHLKKSDDVKEIKTEEKPTTSCEVKDSSFSVIEKFVQNSEWDKLNTDSLVHLKESSNLQTIIDELQKANDKILEVRRALGVSKQVDQA